MLQLKLIWKYWHSYATAKINLEILAFLYCGEFVKTPIQDNFLFKTTEDKLFLKQASIP